MLKSALFIQVAGKVKSICQSLATPKESNARALAKLFPASVKRNFDPMSDCVNSDNKRKKKAQTKGRPKVITVVFLAKNPGIIPKGNARAELKSKGRVKDVPFLRCIDFSEVKDLIKHVFPGLNEFTFLQGNKDNTLSKASRQDFNGREVIELVKHGCLYLEEKSPKLPVPTKPSLEEPAVSTSAGLPPSSNSLPAPAAFVEVASNPLIREADEILEKLNVCL